MYYRLSADICLFLRIHPTDVIMNDLSASQLSVSHKLQISGLPFIDLTTLYMILQHNGSLMAKILSNERTTDIQKSFL